MKQEFKGIKDLTHSQKSILEDLFKNPKGSHRSFIEKRTGLSESAITKGIRRLEDRGILRSHRGYIKLMVLNLDEE